MRLALRAVVILAALWAGQTVWACPEPTVTWSPNPVCVGCQSVLTLGYTYVEGYTNDGLPWVDFIEIVATSNSPTAHGTKINNVTNAIIRWTDPGYCSVVVTSKLNYICLSNNAHGTTTNSSVTPFTVSRMETFKLTDATNASNSKQETTDDDASPTDNVLILGEDTNGHARVAIDLTMTPTNGNAGNIFKWQISGSGWAPASGNFSGGTITSLWTDAGGDVDREFTVVVHCNCGEGGDCENCTYRRMLKIAVLKVDIFPLEMDATESLNSGAFICTVTPSGLNPSYQWLTGAVNDAWPATAGNNPELDYSAPTASSTAVNETRWFAETPDRRQVVDGWVCCYNINCEVTVGCVKSRAFFPAILSVSVDMSGQTTGCVFQDWESIAVAQDSNGVWRVTGQGNFSRSMPVASVNMPASSQFYNKAMAHENKHVEQWMTGMFKDLKDADTLYASTLNTLTSTISEADLRAKILVAVYNQSTADDQIYNGKLCDAEDEAFDAENAVEPDFLELDDVDWRPIYGCQ